MNENESLQKIKQSPVGGFILGVALSAITFLGSFGLVDQETTDAARTLKSSFSQEQIEAYAAIRAEFNAALADEKMAPQSLFTFGTQQQLLNGTTAHLVALYGVLDDYLTAKQIDEIESKVRTRVPELLDELNQASEPLR